MLATKLIKHLKKFVKDYGDLECYTSECGSTSSSYEEFPVHEVRVENGEGGQAITKRIMIG